MGVGETRGHGEGETGRKCEVIARTIGTKRSQQYETSSVAMLREIAASAAVPGLLAMTNVLFGIWNVECGIKSGRRLGLVHGF